MKRPATELIQLRYSCRNYVDSPLEREPREELTAVLESLTSGPFGNSCRLALLAATQDDRDALKGLGTYGFIKGATGFIAGAVIGGPGDLEDYGFCLEQAVLAATDLDLGSCWLGGSFSKSSFAKKIGLRGAEMMPAVVAIGYPRENSREHWIRRSAGSDRRLPADQLFFDGSPAVPLTPEAAGAYSGVLDAVRWAPSASNKQPWRLLRDGVGWHFYLCRTPGYNKGLIKSLIRLADLQRVDVGIAMCHFELAASDAGLTGHWDVAAPRAVPAAGAGAGFEGWEHVASWVV